ncbi:MAG: lipoate--protein ligase family protein [Candidatus Aenigmarchaeota archaeon]|nr:lipoate--protein ligase family protein [Candidatus Aenigmarchaeota archaeon]
MDSYKLICSALIKGLNGAGVPAEFSKINDIAVDGKKISGSAQTRKDGALLQHGTLLLDTNIEKMFTVLKVPKEKLKDKGIKNVKERVAPLRISKNEAIKAVKSGFSGVFGALEESKLTMEELTAAAKLSKGRYSNKEWNFRR